MGCIEFDTLLEETGKVLVLWADVDLAAHKRERYIRNPHGWGLLEDITAYRGLFKYGYRDFYP